MSKSVAAKTPKSGELQQHQLNTGKVTVGGSSSTSKTPPVRLTRSISSKPGFEASRRSALPKTHLIKAKVKSNPALLKSQDGIQRSTKDDHGSPVLPVGGQARRFTKRGESLRLSFSSFACF